MISTGCSPGGENKMGFVTPRMMYSRTITRIGSNRQETPCPRDVGHRASLVTDCSACGRRYSTVCGVARTLVTFYSASTAISRHTVNTQPPPFTIFIRPPPLGPRFTGLADDIVEMYQDNLKDLAEHRASPVSVIDPINQIYRYMRHSKLQYGVLSTYERTWFFQRPQDNQRRCLNRTRQAETRLRRLVNTHGVPPAFARNLQQVIAQGALLYAAELTWNAGAGMEGQHQATINCMGRDTLGAFQPTPLGIVVAGGGLVLAQALLDRRQARFTQRLLARPRINRDSSPLAGP